ncbi:MAG: LamG-like jellyroll fold domain-containing protein, partial [Bacteroidota bacterium]
MLLNIRVIAQDSKLSALPADGKVTLSGSNLDWSLNPPTHVDIYKGTSNPPTDLYDIITPVPASFDWVDNEVENGVFYYYQFVARDENNGTVDEPSNVTGAMPAEGRGSYYVFDGIDDQVQQLNNEYMTRVNFIRFDFKIDELPTDKNAEIFRIQFKGTSSNNRSVLSVIHTADSLQVVVDRDTAPMIGRPSKGKSILTMPSVADGEWHEFRMIDIVRTQLTVRIDQDLYFIDMRDPGGVFDIPLVGAHDIFIGGQINDTTAYFNGCFDNLRFFGRFEQEGCWNFDEPSAELTVFDKGRKIRTMQKVGGVKSAADVFNPIILQAIAGKEGRIQLSSSTESVLNKLSSFTLFRQALPSGPVDTLKNDLDLVDFFPYEDLTVVQGTPYQYTIQYTASLSPTNDTTIAISDYNVPAMDFGNHYQFDGVDDVVTPDQAIINDDEGTIEFLVKIQPEDSPLPGSSLALAGKQNNAFRNGFMILHDNSRVWCQFRNGAGTRNNLYPARAVSLTDGKWHHVALTYVVGDSATLYVDGEQVVSGDINNLNFTTAPIQFGRAPDPFGAPLKGGLDEVVIWDQVLSPEEIGLRAFAKVRGDSEGLLASYHFDEGAGSIAYDSGPQDVHAQINGAITGQNTTDIPVRWLGTMSASWSEQENWSSGFVPQTDDNLVITALGNSPIIASTDVVEINDLMINQGASLTLESGGILAINGEVLNQGNFTAKRIPEANGKYSMIGSPLVDADISDFGADLTFGYDPLTATFTQEAGTAFPGNGYFVSYFENDPEIVLSGTPNSGNVSVPLTISLESPISYNLVA